LGTVLTEEFLRAIDSAFVFAEEASRYARNHAASSSGAPFFLYMAMQSVHEPLQAPDSYVAQYASAIADFDRRVTAAMVTAMDDGIGQCVNMSPALSWSYVHALFCAHVHALVLRTFSNWKSLVLLGVRLMDRFV